MKKWKQVVLVATLALLLGLATKAESQAAQVQGVKQTDASTSSVSVSCDAVLGAEWYFLEASTDGNTWYYMDYSYNPSSLYASGLSAGSTYYVRVIATTDWDYGFSEDRSKYLNYACADASAPIEVVTVPDGSNASIVQSGAALNSISMTVSGVQGANYYFLGGASDYTHALLQVYGSSAEPTVTMSGLAPNTSMTLYAYACRQSASTGFIAHPTYSTATAYSAKTLSGKINKNNFGISRSYSNINSYTFAVSSGFVADGYEFQFQDVKGNVKKTVDTTSTSVGVSNFINGTFYKYRVRSYVNCGMTKQPSDWSDFRYIGVSKDVNGTSRRKGNKRTLHMNWKKVSGASQYVVYISKSETGGYKKVKALSSKKSSIKITKFGKKKLKKGTTYYVKLVVKGKDGKKLVSSDVSKIAYSTY